MLYPLSEIFDSLQGEGHYMGLRMLFVRFAGCTVGKRFPKEMYGDKPSEIPSGNDLPIYSEQCTTWDGRKFQCDTDFRVKMRMTKDQIFALQPKEVTHVCLTGGEPLMHDLGPLVDLYMAKGVFVHIETSGTIVPKWDCFRPGIWITLSPKLGCREEMIRRSDEVKLLVGPDFDPAKVPDLVKTHRRVFISPINFDDELNMENMQRCLKLQETFPRWRITIQLHKILGVR